MLYDAIIENGTDTLKPGHFEMPVHEVQGFLNRLRPSGRQATWRSIGWTVFAVVLAELLATASGLWPSASAIVMLRLQPKDAVDTPLLYWSDYNPGAGELVYFTSMLVFLGLATWMIGRSDTALWRTPLLAGERQSGWCVALRVGLAVLAVDLLWRSLTVSGPGSLPVQFRVIVAVAALTTIAHAWLRVRSLTEEHPELHGSFVIASLAVLAYVILTIAFSKFSTVAVAFPAVSGELKALQLAAVIVSSFVLATYVYFVALTPARPEEDLSTSHEPGANGQALTGASLTRRYGRVDPKLRRNYPYVVEITPSGVPFVTFGPSQGGGMPGVLAVISHDAVGRLIAYRNRDGVFELVNDNRLFLSDEPYLILDVDAISQEFRGSVVINAALQRSKWLEGRLHWSLELPCNDLPRSITTSAWQTLRQKLANRDEVIRRIEASILQRFETFCDLLQEAPPAVVTDRLERMLGLRFVGDPGLPGGMEIPGSSTLERAGVPALHLALIEECSALARLRFKQAVIQEWLADADRAQTEVLRLVGGVRKQLVVESLATALQVQRTPASRSRAAGLGELDDLLSHFSFGTLEDAEQVRLSAEGERCLTEATKVVRENLTETEAEYQRRAAEFREELKHARDTERAKQDCALAVARIASQGIFSPENAGYILQDLGMSEFIGGMLELIEKRASGLASER